MTNYKRVSFDNHFLKSGFDTDSDFDFDSEPDSEPDSDFDFEPESDFEPEPYNSFSISRKKIMSNCKLYSTKIYNLSNNELINLMINNVYHYPSLSKLAFKILIYRNYLKLLISADKQIIDPNIFVLNKDIHYIDISIEINNVVYNLVQDIMISKCKTYVSGNIYGFNKFNRFNTFNTFNKETSSAEYDNRTFIYIENNQIKINRIGQLIRLFAKKYNQFGSIFKYVFIKHKIYKLIKTVTLFGLVASLIYVIKISIL
jgi:hypothetical protein